MRLRKKTELRKIIKERVGTVGEYDIVLIDRYGEWSIHSTGTACPNEMKVCIRTFLSYIDTGVTIDKSITEAFLDIELEMKHFFRES